MKSRRLAWAGHVARMGEDLKVGDHLEDSHVDGRIILKLIFEE
jgi:hypothetical protein